MPIPRNIFQTWHTNELPPGMNSAVLSVKVANPGFRHFLFSDDDCRAFIAINFGGAVLAAYDSLLPGAFKADLWRYCVLYKCGGIYLDIKFIPVNGFSFIDIMNKNHLVLDDDQNGIYNAFMICEPRLPLLAQCIARIVHNVKTKYYGVNPLEPTGPKLFIQFVPMNDPMIDMRHTFDGNTKRILRNKQLLLYSYPSYIDEFDEFKKTEHYSIMWQEKRIYKQPPPAPLPPNVTAITRPSFTR